jgi:hypothetical protein
MHIFIINLLDDIRNNLAVGHIHPPKIGRGGRFVTQLQLHISGGRKDSLLVLFLSLLYVAALNATKGRNTKIFDIFSAKICSDTIIR